MINNNMDDKKEEQVESKETSKTPDETSGVYFQSHVKIFDPETQEVYFAGRA